VDIQSGDEDLAADELMSTLTERAKAAGKTEEEINSAMEE